MSESKKMSGRRIMLRAIRGAAVVTMVAGATSIAVPASAAPQHHTAASTKYYFAAGLLGRNEVREPGKKVNDRDGAAVAKFRISGDRFYYFVEWRRTARPTAFHIHRGKAGVNGPVVIDLLSNGTIRGNTSKGSVRVSSRLLRDIKKNPKNWYANLHTSQFPDGAVRGQLHKGGRW
ncbi:CHRD domain-containing protein [Herbidospora daliensis]|uniref:CHRD domain-containing protein n=1 Tax=Herbidospora daliensis TaxID=295585 RepID=UPI000A041D76|nr:CHRD domain-containing protein [Herbidospora daliensis]